MLKPPDDNEFFVYLLTAGIILVVTVIMVGARHADLL